MLKNLGRSGGPEEDRTPDLFIANDTLNRYINDLRHRNNVVKSPKTGGGCTNRAQLPVHLGPLFVADHMGRLSYIPEREIITKGARV
jgi:hypothetical protein